MKKKIFRRGPMGSLMDEYERALEDFKNRLSEISLPFFKKKLWKEGELHSVKEICEHVERAGYGYINHFSRRTGLPVHDIPSKPLNSVEEAVKRLEEMFRYTLGKTKAENEHDR